MSESLFLNQNVQEFSLSHPQEEGWKVYELPEGVLCEYSFRLLPDFLRDRYPDVVRRNCTLKVMTPEELTGTPEYVHPAEAGTEWDLRHELDGTHWFGLIQIEWNKQPIHFLRLSLVTGPVCFSIIRVATKSNVALRRLSQELNAYGLSRQKIEGRRIRVVNGDDILITATPWDEIVLPAGFAESIKRNVDGFFQGKERYRTLGIPYRRGLLFAGPAGCGKTLTLKALAYEQSAQMITVLGRADVEDRHIETAFEIAGAQGPSIVIFEDLDKLVESEEISLSHFLNILDGLKTLNGVMVIATANEPERLDPALLCRPSRFDRVWTFPLPATEQRLTLLRKRGSKHFSDFALEEAARRSQGFSMAYVQEIIVNALLEAAHADTAPVDEFLLNSVEVLRMQRKMVAKPLQSLIEHETVGFSGLNKGED